MSRSIGPVETDPESKRLRSIGTNPGPQILGRSMLRFPYPLRVAESIQLLVSQVSVAESPGSTVVGLTVNELIVQAGIGGATVTVTAAVRELKPERAAEILYILLVRSGPVETEPEIALLETAYPETDTTSQFVVVQESVEAP